ncbi:hypothetical protein E2C01_063898 [Portunus trituberculatus]|uniref:Uncharacterized protein n=1 Tax=Portunus trituberculatus TaxID=210409 RepID=A0A5B7HKA0_PORTR|nr:hypothetical protein [Portunus trituberculatus]
MLVCSRRPADTGRAKSHSSTASFLVYPGSITLGRTCTTLTSIVRLSIAGPHNPLVWLARRDPQRTGGVRELQEGSRHTGRERGREVSETDVKENEGLWRISFGIIVICTTVPLAEQTSTFEPSP